MSPTKIYVINLNDIERTITAGKIKDMQLARHGCQARLPRFAEESACDSACVILYYATCATV